MNAIHAKTLVLDTHIDIRWPETPDWTQETRQLVDLPKMRQGQMSAAIFIAYVPQGRRDASGHAQAAARAEAMLQHIRNRATAPGTRFCATPDALEACFAAGDTAVLSAVENGYAMGHDLSRIAAWRALGAVYLTLTHDGHNEISDSARPKANLGDAPSEHGGLSAFGETAVADLVVLDSLMYVHVNERSMARSMAREAEANDNTNDVSYAKANDLDYCYDYCYCSFVCRTDNHVESGNRILPKGLYHIHCGFIIRKQHKNKLKIQYSLPRYITIRVNSYFVIVIHRCQNLLENPNRLLQLNRIKKKRSLLKKPPSILPITITRKTAKTQTQHQHMRCLIQDT
ncbi:MAG: hypothetical protein EBX37_02460 [Alphaproteobacteria bacterium]|nr:hypothetical protein [Alphaproteobacteria bacterium]